MTRKELLLSPEYWLTKTQTKLFNALVKYANVDTEEKLNHKLLNMNTSTNTLRKIMKMNYDDKLSKFIQTSLELGFYPNIELIPINKNNDNNNDNVLI